MKMKNDIRIEEELTCHFKIDMRIGRAQKRILAERKECLKSVLNKTLEHCMTRKPQIKDIFLDRICWKA